MRNLILLSGCLFFNMKWCTQNTVDYAFLTLRTARAQKFPWTVFFIEYWREVECGILVVKRGKFKVTVYQRPGLWIGLCTGRNWQPEDVADGKCQMLHVVCVDYLHSQDNP